jgi:Cu/Ag efflux protein CusF
LFGRPWRSGALQDATTWRRACGAFVDLVREIVFHRIWNQSSCCQVVTDGQNWEVIMTLAKISLASAAAITLISWGALAQENQNTGRITQLDHINGKMTLQHAPAGTVGAVGASSLVDEYKIQDGLAKDLHAGDEVDFTAAQIGGVLTITKIQKK